MQIVYELFHVINPSLPDFIYNMFIKFDPMKVEFWTYFVLLVLVLTAAYFISAYQIKYAKITILISIALYLIGKPYQVGFKNYFLNGGFGSLVHLVIAVSFVVVVIKSLIQWLIILPTRYYFLQREGSAYNRNMQKRQQRNQVQQRKKQGKLAKQQMLMQQKREQQLQQQAMPKQTKRNKLGFPNRKPSANQSDDYDKYTRDHNDSNDLDFYL